LAVGHGSGAGQNGVGQLGDGSQVDRLQPVAVFSLPAAKDMAIFKD